MDLGAIEWYHRLRNELYHQGNGLTIDREKVEVYAELAKILFKNLFGVEILDDSASGAEILGEFMELWLELENGLYSIAWDHSLTGLRTRSVLEACRFLRSGGLITDAEAAQIEALRRVRNEVIHGSAPHREVLTPELMEQLRLLVARYKEDVAQTTRDDT